MDTRKKNRIIRVTLWAGIVFCAGLMYAYLYSYYSIRIPCVFHTVTGLYCPGCGISRMCIALLHFNFKGAFSYNQGVMLALPIMIIIAAQVIIKYIKSGNTRLTKGQNIVVWVLVIYFITFGIIRNILVFIYSQPTPL
ncbi:DUF2752 domain-containing protein [Anaerovorax odorimutans]|uniref:DUF2752 domain-containing protein n=1 Tax=Anaerovorax odorimutans TaxID=109327 RepID=UPI00055A04A1|nr:DUF2752 domain-containing protein [Anaerovorax odorimutans]